MFLHKRVAGLIQVAILLFFYSCETRKSIPLAPGVDTVRIRSWKENLDSFYDQLYNTNNVDYARKALPFADSLDQLESTLLNDSSQRLYYIKSTLRKAYCYYQLMDYISSREMFDKFLYLHDQYHADLPAFAAYAQLTVANIYSQYGDYKKAVSLLSESLRYFTQQKNEGNMASCLLNISIALKELKRYDQARDSLDQLLRLPAVSDNRKAKACIELADIYTRQNMLPQAEQEIRRAKIFVDAVSPGSERTGILSHYFEIEGDRQLAGNSPKEALALYQWALDSIKTNSQNLRSREIGKLYISMGKASERLQLTDTALLFYNKALYAVTDADTLNNLWLPQQKDLYAENTIAEALLARASCLTRTSNQLQQLENAVHCYDLAFGIQKKLLDAFSYDESRFFLLEDTHRQTTEAIRLCYRLYQQTKNDGWTNQAFLFAERNKAFVLNESIRRNIAASLFMQEDSSYSAFQSIQARLASLDIELNKQRITGSPDTALTSKLLADKQKTEVYLLQAENVMKVKNPQYSNWLGTDENMNAREIIEPFISSRSALAEYFVDDSVIYLFTAGNGKNLSFSLLAADTKEVCSDFLSYFTNRNAILNNPAAYALAARRLYDRLLLPKTDAGNSSITIIPDGILSLVPFDALVTGGGSSDNISSFPFLIKEATLSYAFSCRTVLMQRRFQTGSGKNGLIAFAPVFANRERNLAPLLHSSEELEAIHSLYPTGMFFANGMASLKQFRNECSNASIIHLATHAAAGTDSTMAAIEFSDSALYLSSIYSLPINAKLVVLSGCETGVGNINRTEGLMSLARGFSYAGTQNVVAGLWQTEDRTSGELFKDFYADLRTHSIAASLRNAKLKILKNASVSQSSPFYWGGYVFIGVPGEKINEPMAEDRPFIFIAAVLLLIGTGLVVKKKIS